MKSSTSLYFFFLLSENAANTDSVAHGQLQKCPLFDQEPLVIAPFFYIARHNSVADFEPTGLLMESEFNTRHSLKLVFLLIEYFTSRI